MNCKLEMQPASQSPTEQNSHLTNETSPHYCLLPRLGRCFGLRFLICQRVLCHQMIYTWAGGWVQGLQFPRNVWPRLDTNQLPRKFVKISIHTTHCTPPSRNILKNKYTIRSIVTCSSSHLVNQSSGHLVIRSSGHLLILSSCHSVILYPIIQSLGHPVIPLSHHPIIQSSNHHIISTCSWTN